MLKIRQSWDCLIFIIGIPILVRRHHYIEMAPWCFNTRSSVTTVPSSPQNIFSCQRVKWHHWAHFFLCPPTVVVMETQINGLVQNCGICNALATEILQSCTEPLIRLNTLQPELIEMYMKMSSVKWQQFWQCANVPMAWCQWGYSEAINWHRSITTYGITRPNSANSLADECHWNLLSWCRQA